MIDNQKIELGDVVRHCINGFEGVVIGKVAYLTGCLQVLVTPTKTDSNGQPQEPHWYDCGVVSLVRAGEYAHLAPAFDQRQSQPLPRGGDLLPPK